MQVAEVVLLFTVLLGEYEVGTSFKVLYLQRILNILISKLYFCGIYKQQ